jgi:hypothetical protein
MSMDPKPIDLVKGALETGLELAMDEMARCEVGGDDAGYAEAESKSTAFKVALTLCGREGTLPATPSIASALSSAIAIANEAVTEWDRAPASARPGKLLMALAGRAPGYRKETDLVHAAMFQATAKFSGAACS